MHARVISLQAVAGIARRQLGRLYRYFVPKLLTASEKALIRENTAFWSQYVGNRQGGQDAGYLLVEQHNSPIHLLCNASLATIVSHARNLRPLFVLNSLQDSSIRRLLESYYPDSTFVYTDSWRYLIPRILTRFQATKAFRALESPEDILDFRVDGIKFGDLVYDGVLARGYATIRRLDGEVLSAIRAFLWHRYVIKDIIKRYKIKASVFSHTIGLSSGTFTRYLLQNGIEVLCRTGSYQLQVKKYRGLDEVGVYPLRPEPRYFSFLMNRSDNTVLRLADSYLHDRFHQNVRHIAVDLAFDRRKRVFESKEEFCSHFNLDPALKVVFVMLHAFNDHPHAHFAKPMLFQDYYDWFEKTLEMAKSIHSVNWIFKEHPAAEFYPTKDVSLDAVFGYVAQPHIRFLNRNADFNSRSLLHIADTIVTCLGTAGLEYSCYGIPCVLAGESPYSGFGFTIEPRDAAEYEEQLRSLHELPRLNESQIKAAKIVLFFQLSMMQGAHYLFCPYYDLWQTWEINPQEVWRDAAELMKNGNKEEMRRQIDIISDFVRNPSYTQYVNLKKYDFMKEAVYRH